MKRVLVIALLTFLAASLWQAAALSLPYNLNILCLPPILLAFSLQFFKPLETIWICLIGGAIVDILGGFSIGVNMSLMLVFAFILGATNIFIGRLSLRDLSIYVAGLSFIYRLAFFLTVLVLLAQKTNMSLGQLLLGPLIDMLLSYVFFVVSAKILVALKAFERSDFIKYGAGS